MEALAFVIGYMLLCCLFIWLFVFYPMFEKWKTKHFWVYGTCSGRKARKHTINKNVQFILWRAGEQGHKEDYWVDFDSSWWSGFRENNIDDIKG